MPGRPPKPTALRILQGNAGKRAINKEEPKPEAGAVPPPWLGPDPRKEWNRLAPELERLGVLTVLDADALAVLCTLIVAFKEALQEGKVSPTMAAEIRAYYGRFGMTPADRVRVKVEPKKPDSKLTKYTSGA